MKTFCAFVAGLILLWLLDDSPEVCRLGIALTIVSVIALALVEFTEIIVDAFPSSVMREDDSEEDEESREEQLLTEILEAVKDLKPKQVFVVDRREEAVMPLKRNESGRLEVDPTKDIKAFPPDPPRPRSREVG